MGIITAMTNVFDAVFQWILSAVNAVIPIFWTAGSGDTGGSLTFMGILALIGLAISIFFLLVGLIQNFLHLRG